MLQVLDIKDANELADLLALKVAQAQPTEPEMERLISKKTLAEMLEISFSSIERLIRESKLPSYRIRGRIRFKYSEVMDLVNNGFVNFENPTA